jgi:tetratricopeptide (TPR) repeat protein
MAAPVSESSPGRVARSAPGSDEGVLSGGGVEPAAPARADARGEGRSEGRGELDGEPEAAPAELAQLRRRLDDLGAQQRKSHTSVQQLADSVAALVTAHRRRVRWLNLNSFAAYLIFTVLLGTAFYMVYLRRAAAIGAELRELTAQRAAAVARADAASAELTAQKTRSQKAAEAFALFEKGEAAAAEQALAQAGGALSPLEEAALAGVRDKAAAVAFERAYGEGVAAFRAGELAKAVASLERAVASAPSAGGKAGAAQYYLGMSLLRGGELARARIALEAALVAGAEMDDARYQLATALDRAGEIGRARTEYEKFATAHPKLGLAVYAWRRSAVLARWGKAAPPLPGATPAAAPVPGAGAPPAAAPVPGAAPARAWPARPKWKAAPAQGAAPAPAAVAPPPPAAEPAPPPAPSDETPQ